MPRKVARSPRLGLMLLASKIERAANGLIETRRLDTIMRRPRSLRVVAGMAFGQPLKLGHSKDLDVFSRHLADPGQLTVWQYPVWKDTGSVFSICR